MSLNTSSAVTTGGFGAAGSYVTSTSSASGTSSGWVIVTGSTGSTGNSLSVTGNAPIPHPARGGRISDQERFTLDLPDGSVFHYDRGKYRIEDAAAKITYSANRSRDFNRFVNASDLVAEFIEFAAKTAGGPDEPADILKLPLDLFIAFLIVRASEQDSEVPPDVAVAKLDRDIPIALLPPPRPCMVRGRCSYCGRFVKDRVRDAGILACSPEHAQRAIELVGGW